MDKIKVEKTEGCEVIKFRDGQLTLDYAEDDDSELVYLSCFGVSRPGRGTGTELLKRTIKSIRRRHPNIGRVYLICHPNNRSRNLYKRLGFVEDGARSPTNIVMSLWLN